MGKDIMVVAEHLRGQVADVTFELLGKGRELAGATGGRLLALVLGSAISGVAGQLGAADSVLVLDAPRLEHFTPEAHGRATAAVVRERVPQLVLVGNTSAGLDLGAAVAAATALPMLAYCTGLALEGDTVVATSQLYGGKVMVEATAPGGVASVLPGSLPAAAGRGTGASIEGLACPDLGSLRTRFKQLIEPEAGDVDITKEAVLVSIGRGIGDQGNIQLAMDLAGALGAQVAASRPIIDNGWLPKSRQVGKSGLSVKPKCYLCFGISGAPEHLEGMKDSALIIAINTDAGAPIFGVAHYGAVADMFDIIPALTDQVAG